jgi:hypothetical protein
LTIYFGVQRGNVDQRLNNIGAYQETVNALFQLSYDALKSKSYSINPGLRSQMHFQLPWASLMPAL